MSYTIEASFDVPEKDVDHWKMVIGVLEKEVGGANLQEAMSWLGEEVDSELEAILEDEDLGPLVFNLEDSDVQDNRFMLMFECGNDDFAVHLKSLLKLCGVQNLKVDLR